MIPFHIVFTELNFAYLSLVTSLCLASHTRRHLVSFCFKLEGSLRNDGKLGATRFCIGHTHHITIVYDDNVGNLSETKALSISRSYALAGFR
ncbi:unnamed protein product [Cylicocyclus nassatus]|uniref:Secreted protein n=1 Tax=Cylicocyclus nassatus TaxID=53992 RepID=A0AA36M619_CYLNA|nr:unnamed protein product [Cylicocyclus nassatus]